MDPVLKIYLQFTQPSSRRPPLRPFKNRYRHKTVVLAYSIVHNSFYGITTTCTVAENNEETSNNCVHELVLCDTPSYRILRDLASCECNIQLQKSTLLAIVGSISIFHEKTSNAVIVCTLAIKFNF